MKKNLLAFSMLMFALMFGFGLTASAAVPDASTTLSTLGESVINTGVSFLTTIFTTYFPYVLMAIALTAIVGIVISLVYIPFRKKR